MHTKEIDVFSFQIVNRESKRKIDEENSIKKLRDRDFESIIESTKYDDILEKLEEHLSVTFTPSSKVKDVFIALNNKKVKDDDFICFIEEIFDSCIDEVKQMNKTISESVEMKHEPTRKRKRSRNFFDSASSLFMSAIRGGRTNKKKYKKKRKNRNAISRKKKRTVA